MTTALKDGHAPAWRGKATFKKTVLGGKLAAQLKVLGQSSATRPRGSWGRTPSLGNRRSSVPGEGSSTEAPPDLGSYGSVREVPQKRAHQKAENTEPNLGDRKAAQFGTY